MRKDRERKVRVGKSEIIMKARSPKAYCTVQKVASHTHKHMCVYTPHIDALMSALG